MPKVTKELMQWDTLEIIKAQVEFLKEDHKDKTDNELFSMASDDPDLFDREWEGICDYLTELMTKNKYGNWKATVNNFGWRSLNGHSSFSATTGQELLKHILPKTDCTFKIYRYGHGFAINNAHHDSPCWAEWYYISPCKNND